MNMWDSNTALSRKCSPCELCVKSQNVANAISSNKSWMGATREAPFLIYNLIYDNRRTE